MSITNSTKSNRLLQSKRYTQTQLSDAQEAFTSVLDINASEIYSQQNLIPTSSLIYSGSSQNGSFVTFGGQNILKFYYRQRLVPSDTLDTSNYSTWFFLDPTASIDYTTGVNAGVLNARQQGSFISPKYAPTLGGNTENTTPGYQVKLTDSTGTIIDPALYTFDYKDGVLQFIGNSGYTSISTILNLTAYQYVGRTVASNDILGYTGSFQGNLSGTASYATTASYVLNSTSLSSNLIFTGSVTASVDISNNIFLIKSASVNFLTITNNTTTIQNDIFLIKDLSNRTVFTVSQSIVYFPTQSATLSNAVASAGGIYFTSSSFYVGLED
jgi:hypothetical protein